MNKFLNYFNETIEYPSNVIVNPIPLGELWTYISTTFLNGFINYCKIHKIYLLDRYTDQNELIENVNYMEEKGITKWKKFNGTKKELLNLVLNDKAFFFHTDLYCFKDDIIILGKADKNVWIYFWFDSDSSDCCIGKFYTKDQDSEVEHKLHQYLLELKKDQKYVKNFYELPNRFALGWIKF